VVFETACRSLPIELLLKIWFLPCNPSVLQDLSQQASHENYEQYIIRPKRIAGIVLIFKHILPTCTARMSADNSREFRVFISGIALVDRFHALREKNMATFTSLEHYLL